MNNKLFDLAMASLILLMGLAIIAEVVVVVK
jgi:hypothetical protein